MYWHTACVQVAAHIVHKGSPPYDRRCDIYSYGVLVWEIFHASVPYMETGLDQVFPKKG